MLILKKIIVESTLIYIDLYFAVMVKSKAVLLLQYISYHPVPVNRFSRGQCIGGLRWSQKSFRFGFRKQLVGRYFRGP